MSPLPLCRLLILPPPTVQKIDMQTDHVIYFYSAP